MIETISTDSYIISQDGHSLLTAKYEYTQRIERGM